nr:hypothetical protein CFP56_09715 [Quercus suber]
MSLPTFFDCRFPRRRQSILNVVSKLVFGVSSKRLYIHVSRRLLGSWPHAGRHQHPDDRVGRSQDTQRIVTLYFTLPHRLSATLFNVSDHTDILAQTRQRRARDRTLWSPARVLLSWRTPLGTATLIDICASTAHELGAAGTRQSQTAQQRASSEREQLCAGAQDLCALTRGEKGGRASLMVASSNGQGDDQALVD